MKLRSQIETQIARYLDRPDLSDQISFWFELAHRDLQRLQNFKFMEGVAVETITTPRDESFCIPCNMKEPHGPQGLQAFDPTCSQILGFYAQTDIDQIRWMRRGYEEQFRGQDMRIEDRRDFRGDWHDIGQFAIWNGQIEIYPRPGSAFVGKQWRFYYYLWVDPPTLDATGPGLGHDYLTDNAFDYLLYRSLMESAPYLVADERLQVWATLMGRAETRIVGADVSATWAGNLQMRG